MAEEHILSQDNGKKRYIDEVTALPRHSPLPFLMTSYGRDEISFFQAVKARLVKFDSTGSATAT